MNTGYCFLSYSSADALDFATKLDKQLERCTPSINVWFDKRNLPPSEEWHSRIIEAIENCKIFLFVMTPNSVKENSYCNQEWLHALTYKKRIILLWLKDNTNIPTELQGCECIDFRKSFDNGLAKLCLHILSMDSS